MSNVELRTLFLGLLVFSPISSLITKDLLHLPFSLPELLLIPFLPTFIKIFDINRISLVHYIYPILIWMGLFSVSLISSTYTLNDIIGCGRTYLYIFIFITIFSNQAIINYRLFFILSIGTLLGWVIQCLYGFLQLTDGILVISYGPMLVIPILFAYSAINYNNQAIILILIIGFIIGTLGLLRRVIIVSIWNFIIIIYWKLKNSHKVPFKAIFSIAIITLLLFCAYPFIRNTTKEYNYDMYVRVIEKTEGLFNGNGNSGDEARISMFKSIFSNDIFFAVLPHGFLSKDYGGKGNGLYNDMPILEIIYTFGLPITSLLLVYFSLNCYNILNKIKYGKLKKEAITFPIGFMTIFCLLFLEGSFLTFPYQSIFTGYILGGLIRKERPSKSKELLF